jgi:acyl-CoA reductase-like NAD-dependent aldehyde dehydrogenase
MINAAAASRAERWVADAVAAGAELLVGGPVRGTLFPATVLTGTDTTMQVACEEVFAPVVTVERYDDFDEAIAEADRPGSGLQVGLFTSDLTLVRRLYSAAHVGSVIVNDVNSWRVDPMPFGGWGTSGYGREGLRREIRQQMDERLLVQTIPPRPATAGAVPTRGDQS